MMVIVRDFTERTQLEDELSRRLETLQREQAFTRAVVDVAPVVFLLVDTEGRIVRFNASAEELFGITDDERVRGKLWWDVFLPEENREGAQIYLRRMNEGAERAPRRGRLDRRGRTAASSSRPTCAGSSTARATSAT